MNVSYSTIPSGERLTDVKYPLKWEDIDWKTVNEKVNKLQTRITKAVRQRKWHSVKRLQYLLTNSFHARLLAVKKVTQKILAHGFLNSYQGLMRQLKSCQNLLA